MAEHTVEFHPDDVTAAIEAVANASDRHPEWTKRRLREAIEFVQTHPREHQDFAAHQALAMKVFLAICKQTGRDIDDFRARVVN